MRLWSAAVNNPQSAAGQVKHMSQKGFQTNTKFFKTRMSSRPSIDKVISYDAASLLEGIREKPVDENWNNLNMPSIGK